MHFTAALTAAALLCLQGVLATPTPVAPRQPEFSEATTCYSEPGQWYDNGCIICTDPSCTMVMIDPCTTNCTKTGNACSYGEQGGIICT